MKALSVRQPYAEQIASGEKTSEFRSRRTSHRGPLLICASKTVDEGGEGLPTGVAICVVEVTGCRELDNGDFAWDVARPERVDPRPTKGSLGFFDVPDEEIFRVPKARPGKVSR